MTGLRIADISTPSAPIEIGFYEGSPTYSSGVMTLGNYAYVADDTRGLRIIDISNPTAPIEVGFYNTWGASNLTVSGSYAYVPTDRLRIIDISNPTAPTEIGFYDTPGDVYVVSMVGENAYVADGIGGLVILRLEGGLKVYLPLTQR
jgi:hypothetical protein